MMKEVGRQAMTRPVCARDGWQPIETAPRDRKFLGFRPAASNAFDRYMMSVCKYRKSMGGEMLLYSEADYDGIPYHDWTHWQPLPPPPAKGE